jgi:hypothetical protein
MTGSRASEPEVSSPPVRVRDCPECHGTLSEPVSGDLHCYVYCLACGAEFTLDDPRLIVSG